MAQTTTHVNACDASVWLDNAAGTLCDISGSSNEVSMEFSINVAEMRTFGSRWPVRLNCGKDVSVKITAVYSTAADEASDMLKDWFFSADPTARTLKVYIPDKNVGSDVYSGEFVLMSYSFTATAGEPAPIAVTCELQPTGSVTLSTSST